MMFSDVPIWALPDWWRRREELLEYYPELRSVLSPRPGEPLTRLEARVRAIYRSKVDRIRAYQRACLEAQALRQAPPNWEDYKYAKKRSIVRQGRQLRFNI